MNDLYEDLAAEFEMQEETVEILLPRGKTLKVKTLPDASAFIRLRRHAEITQGLVASGGLADLKPYAKTDKSLVLAAVYCEALLVPPMPLATGLKIAKTCGPLMMDIFNKINEVIFPKAMESEKKLLDEAKNESRQTDTGDSCLPSAEMPEESTPTSVPTQNSNTPEI